jgi:hypothetical protein
MQGEARPRRLELDSTVLVAAFESDGALAPAWSRGSTARSVPATPADSLSSSRFFFGQDERLSDEAAVVHAVDND